MWFKEYVFNILIQPFHYIIYTILIGAAIHLVESSVIYAVVAIAFMIPAEKLMRKFFGFDNAGTLSAAGSFAGGAVFSAMINRLNKPKPRGGGGDHGGDDKGGTRQIRKANSGGGGVNPDETLVGTPLQGTRTAGGSAGRAGSGAGTGGGTAGGSAGSGAPVAPGGGPTPGAPVGSGSDDSTGGGAVLPTGRALDNGSGPLPQNPRNFLDRGMHRVSVWDRMKQGTSIEDAARAVGYRYREKAIRGAKTLPRTFRRAAIGGIVGGGLALTGAGVGLASGDPSKAMQYAAAAGAAGYYGSNYYGDKAAGEAKASAKTASAAFWGEQAKLRQQYLFDRDFKRNPENIDTLTKTLGSRDAAKEAMKDGSVQALLNNGISDPTKVAKALKLKSKYKSRGLNDDAALQRAVAMAKWNRDAGKGIYEINSRARQSFITQTVEQIKQSDPNVSENEARNRVEQILEDMESFEL